MATVMEYFDQLLGKARKENVSDIHLREGEPPIFRRSSGLQRLEVAPLGADHLKSMIKGLLPAHQFERYLQTGEGDGAYMGDGELGRVRVNAFKESDCDAVVCRLIPLMPPSLTDLKLPDHLGKLAHFPDGLVLVCGPTGSGKSTTLAAVLREANENRQAHILTLEDPIEYVHPNFKCIISQREIGNDSQSFENAMRSMLRQDPDVVVIGEARDRETMKTALSAAETGHLVFSTLHTVNARETIMRALEMFPADQNEQIRHMLAGVLRAVVVQRMLPKADGSGRVVAQEIMYASERIKDAIQDPAKTDALPEIIAESRTSYGMQTFNQALVEHVLTDTISVDTALSASNRPQDLKLMIQQAKGTTDIHGDGAASSGPAIELS